MGKKILDPVGTLSIGNVVTSGAILYRSNFKRYFQLSLVSIGWLIVAIVVASILAGIGFAVLIAARSWLAAVPIGIVGIGLCLYFLAKYLTARAIISRLAYREAIDVPETVAEATAHLKPRMWGLLRVALLVFIYLSIVATIGGIVYLLIIGLEGMLIGPLGLNARTNIWLALLVSLSVLGLLLVYIASIVWVYGYWFIAELPMAIESPKSANYSIRRSGQLSKHAIGKIVWIMGVAFAIVLPITLISGIPGFIGQIMSIPARLPDTQTLQTAGTLQIVGFLLSLIAELLVMPFWQAVKAILYYDLCNRLEGSDIVRSIESEQPQLLR